MKSYEKLLALIGFAVIILGCSNNLQNETLIEHNTDSLQSNKVSGLVTNEMMENISTGSRSPNNSSNGLPEDINDALAAFMLTLSEKEREQLLLSDNIEVEAYLQVPEDQQSRSDEDNSELIYNNFKQEIESKINTAFWGQTVEDYTIETYGETIYIDKPVFAGYIANSYVFSEDWNSLKELTDHLNVELNIDEIKELHTKLNSLDNNEISRGSSSSSSSGSFLYGTKIVDNLGNNLDHGYILLSKARSTSAYSASFISAMVGYYSHGGLFDKEYWENNGSNDEIYSVLSSQPKENGDLPSDVRAQNPGYNTREPLMYYNKSKKVKVLKPEKYSSTRAKTAVNWAKEHIDTPTRAKFNLPYAEAFNVLGAADDSSHNGNPSSNPYCTKMVYSGWKKAGVNIDSDFLNVNRGTLITPDDISESDTNKYITTKVQILFWSKTFKHKIYEDTTDHVKTFTRFPFTFNNLFTK